MEEPRSLWVTGLMSQSARPLLLLLRCRLGHKFSESERCDHMVTCFCVCGGGVGGYRSVLPSAASPHRITSHRHRGGERAAFKNSLPRSQFHHDHFSGRSLKAPTGRVNSSTRYLTDFLSTRIRQMERLSFRKNQFVRLPLKGL